MIRKWHVLLCAIFLSVPLSGEAQTKRILRIHTAGPNDTNVDNTKLAVEFAEGKTRLRSYPSVRGIDADALHAGQIDHQAIVANCLPRNAVTSTANRN